jgi:hypothetical protein
MLSEASPEPDPASLVIYVGQDKAGHWLVQDSGRRMEGRFVSRAAAMSYARAEREIYHAEVAIAVTPLEPLVSFAPAAAHERALAPWGAAA